MKQLEFLDLRRLNEPYLSDFENATCTNFRSGHYIGGPSVAKFEQEFARYCGVRQCVSVGNGLDALVIALRALGVGVGDEVIVPGQTFVATWLAVSAVGAKIVPVDVSSSTANIDTVLIEGAITPHTKAIIPVHLYGACADMARIMEIARSHSLFVIEDAAQAHGAICGGKRAGAHGHVGCFSFYPSKNLGALGDAGGLVTNDDVVAERARLLGNYGSIQKYVHSEIGMNSRLDPIQASLLSVKLNNIDNIIEKRKKCAAAYSEAISSRSSTKLSRLLKDDIDCVWHNFVVLADDRQQFIDHMKSHGVHTAIHYPIIPSRQECYLEEFGSINLPISERLAAHSVSLPIGEYLNECEINQVVQAISTYL
ncbi:DegT/DnrJ/EryC1/StrS family aminotransferase [Sphingobium sp. LB126]|uniref:DegT/DnrJ/EryC1/StrS family aminotransferase n=1 Tax=Sphingobium sp. LB126 TaxID=1983755 RepID=UPI0012FD03DB|nr:DegT/DnrJ/EryC1/StrS family aminotransferase [Sphingobium sp. LB126]